MEYAIMILALIVLAGIALVALLDTPHTALLAAYVEATDTMEDYNPAYTAAYSYEENV